MSKSLIASVARIRPMYYIVVLIMLCAQIHALDYTYNETTGIYNVTLESGYYQYDATNESYITLLHHGDILEDQNNFYNEKHHNSDYIGKYDESSYFTENEAYDFIRQCDAVIILGNNLLNETSILFEQKDYNGTVECYYKFLKLQAVTPAILEYGSIAARILSNIHSDLGTYNANIDRRMEQDRDDLAYRFEYDDTEARRHAESADAILVEQERKKRYQSYFNDTGIKITTGNYESSKLVTVPMDNYETSFQIRTMYEMEVKHNMISTMAGTGKDYHAENFTTVSFVMGDNLFITIADYMGPAKYKPTNPFDSLSAVERSGYTIFDYGSMFRIDGHTGRKYASYNTKYPDKTNRYAVSYALDSDTFVQVRTIYLDYDKDVALLLETLHIEKKVK